MNSQFIHVYTAEGLLQANVIKSFLESRGIDATVSQEGVGTVYGMAVGRLGEARIYVTDDQAAAARELLAAMERGEYELAEDDEESEENIPD